MTNPNITETSCEWAVSGMDCGSCASKIKDALGRLPGVSDVSVGLMTERLRLTLDEAQTPRIVIEARVKSLGFGIAPKGEAAPRKGFVMPEIAANDLAEAQKDAGPDAGHGSTGHVHDDPADRSKRWYQTAKGRLVIVTGLLLALAWGIEVLTSATIGYWAFFAACLIGVAPIAKRAFAAARMGQPFTIEGLMTIAAIGALFINAAEEAALVVFLFAVGEVLEGVAANKARDGIRALAALVPKTALLEENGVTRTVPAETLAVGQIVLVRPGDRIPADGQISSGISGVDESPVTGESVPRTKGPGEVVFAGSINTEAVLRVTVTKAAQDNTISRIIQLVEEAEEARAPTERFIDRFSRWYMPAIVGVAALVIIIPPLAFGQPWDTWVYRGLSLLLIGCPCALVISVPASIASALSTGARRGLLMKGGAVIEAAAKTTHVAFDKTGTLTHGRPVVTDIVTLGTLDEAAVLSLAAAVEAGSSHPLALAISARAKAKGAPVRAAKDARAIPGKGVGAMIDGAKIWVTNPKYAVESGGLGGLDLRRATALEEEGKTVAVLYRDREPLALFALRDEPRVDAADAVRQLRAMGNHPGDPDGRQPPHRRRHRGQSGDGVLRRDDAGGQAGSDQGDGARRPCDDDRRRHQ